MKIRDLVPNNFLGKESRIGQMHKHSYRHLHTLASEDRNIFLLRSEKYASRL